MFTNLITCTQGRNECWFYVLLYSSYQIRQNCVSEAHLAALLAGNDRSAVLGADEVQAALGLVGAARRRGEGLRTLSQAGGVKRRGKDLAGNFNHDVSTCWKRSW